MSTDSWKRRYPKPLNSFEISGPNRYSLGENHRQDDQYEQFVYQYATDYDTSKNILLYEAELLYNQMIEESVNMYSIDDMTNNTESSSL